MRILIEITWKNQNYNHSLIAFDGTDSHLRLCDGISDVVYDGKTWINGILAKNDDLTYRHVIDLESKTGGLEEISTFNVNLINDGLLEELKAFNIDFLQASLKLQVIEQIFSETEPNFSNFEQLYYCEITSLSLDNNILTLVGTTPRKGLGPIGKNIAYGNIFSQELKRDKNFDTDYIQFSYNDIDSDLTTNNLLKITKVGGLNCPNDTFLGVQRVTSSTPFIETTYALIYNGTTSSAPVNDMYNGLSVVFGPSYSNDNLNTARNIIKFEIVGTSANPKFRFTLDSQLEEPEVAHFDCIKIKSTKRYFELPTDIDADDIELKYKKDDEFYVIPKTSYQVQTISGSTYAVLEPLNDVYTKLNVNNIKIYDLSGLASHTNYLYTSAITTCAGTLENVLTSNLEEFYAFKNEIVWNGSNNIQSFKIELECDELRSVKDADVYLSILMDKPTESYEYYCRYFYEYDNGYNWPCDNSGYFINNDSESYNTPFPMFATKGKFVGVYGLNGLPVSDIRTLIYPTPTISNKLVNSQWLATTNLSASQIARYNSNSATYFEFFENDDIVKLNESDDKHPIINKIVFDVVGIFLGPGTTPLENYPTIINHIGLYKKESFDPSNLESIYADIKGKYDDSFADFIGSDLFIEDMLTSAGYESQNIPPNDTPLRALNHYWVDKDKSLIDLIEDMSSQGLFVTSFDSYNRSINCTLTNFSSHQPEFQILQDSIYEIIETLSDNSNPNIITFPKFISYIKAGTEIYAELIDNKDYFNAFNYSTGSFESYDAQFWWGTILSILLTSRLYNKSVENKHIIIKDDIKFSLIYSDVIPTTSDRETLVKGHFLSYIDSKMTRKYKIKIRVGWDNRNLYIGKIVLINDDRIYKNADLYGNISEIEVDPLTKTVNLGIVINEIKSLDDLSDPIQDIGEGEFEDVETDPIQENGDEGSLDSIYNQGE